MKVSSYEKKNDLENHLKTADFYWGLDYVQAPGHNHQKSYIISTICCKYFILKVFFFKSFETV